MSDLIAELISQYGGVHLHSIHENNMLITAAKCGNVSFVEMIINAPLATYDGSDRITPKVEGIRSAMWAAAERGHVRTVEYLAQIHDFLDGCDRGNLHAVRRIAEHGKVDLSGAIGRAGVRAASRAGHNEILRYLNA